MEGTKQILVVLLLTLASCELIICCKTRKYHGVSLGRNQFGPEALAFDCKGRGPYVGIADGRILKWKGKHGWTLFAVTTPNRPNWCNNGSHDTPTEQFCGRPLGMRFNMATCELYIADSTFGLMRVGRHGGVATALATTVEGLPFSFLNSLDVDFEKGVIYFSESSTIYHHWEAGISINSGDRTGRLMKYNMKTKSVTILLKNLSFANGVALSNSKNFVLVAETTASRVLRYWLTGPRAGTSETFIRLSGGPDNINRNANGDFWIAQQRLPTFNAIKVNNFGQVLDCLHSDKRTNPTDITEFGKRIWMGYINQAYVNYTSVI